MLLEQLRAYSERLPHIAPPGYAETWVRYEIHLDAGGRLLTPEPIDLADATHKGGQRRQVPQVVRASNIKPLLLSDNAEYTFGWARQVEDPDKQTKRAQRAAASHAAYVALLKVCLTATQEPDVASVLRFVVGDPQGQLRLADKYDFGGTIAFRVAGRLVTDIPAVKRFWGDQELGTPDDDAAGERMPCLICGRTRPALKSLPGNIKGLPGGQSSGMALISANKEAFESYGLERSQTSPVCVECADAFTKALNALIREDDHAYKLGNLTFVYWTREEIGFDLNSWFREPDATDVGGLLRAYRSGRPAAPLDDTAFYAVSLSANAARVAVRDWLDTTVGAVKQGLARWFERQQIVDAYGEPGKPLGLYALAAATVRDPHKDLPVPTPRALLYGALTGAPLPMSLLHQAVRRNQAERDVTRPRAALIKLVMLSNLPTLQEDTMIELQPDRPDPAYQCGRLLATLERIQQTALPGINATLVDRFYGTASTAPASVFGTLLRGAQPHLAKLRKERRGTANALQQELEQVLARLHQLPAVLTLKEQGLFALGYYHQRAASRAAARAASAAKRDQAASHTAADQSNQEEN